MCEEKPDLISDFVVTLQREAEELSDGFTIIFRGNEYDFLPKFTDR